MSIFYRRGAIKYPVKVGLLKSQNLLCSDAEPQNFEQKAFFLVLSLKSFF